MKTSFFFLNQFQKLEKIYYAPFLILQRHTVATYLFQTRVPPGNYFDH
jgi:hypothetical protein